jgi:hypothetical protein
MSRDNRIYNDGMLFGAGFASVFWISAIIIIVLLGQG